jgi:IclR family acetate operon transcriptional repressor
MVLEAAETPRKSGFRHSHEEESMSTIGKALTLLDTLSRLDNEAGLTEIAKHCSLDKATTRRFLVELEKHGFVEQLPDTRKYRIGAAPVRLARIREARYPFLRTAIPFVKQLAETSGETVHLSEFSGGRLSTVHVEDSTRAHRVFVEVGTLLPFHATASGLAFIAASPAEEIAAALAQPLEVFTEFTVTEPTEFRRRMEETRAKGYAIGRQGIEVGVISASAAIVAPGARPIGCITIAAPLVRTDDEKIREHGLAVADMAHRISEAFFGSDRQVRPSPHARRTG